MSLYEKPRHVAVGVSKHSLEVKVAPGDGLTPTRVTLAGPRAYARFLSARDLAGDRYDSVLRESYNQLDDALLRPWVVGERDFLRLMRLVNLQVGYDEAAVRSMREDLRHVHARFSRWLPVEDESGAVVDWLLEPGSIDPAEKARMQEVMTHIGWTPGPHALFSYGFDDVSEMATKRDNFYTLFTGGGKTRSALALGEIYRHDEQLPGPTIIVALKRHLRAWEEELGGIASKKPCQILVDTYGKAAYEKWVDKKLPNFDKPFLLISLERLKVLPEEQMQRLHDIAEGSTIILDEAYVLGNPGSAQSRAMRALSGAHHVALSATPIRGYISSLLSPLQWCFRGGSVQLPDYPMNRQSSEKKWAAKFVSRAVGEDGSSKRVPFIRNIHELHDLLSPLMKRRLRSEPEVVRVLGGAVLEEEWIEVDLSPAHYRNYKSVTKQFTDWYVREIEARRKRGEEAYFPPNEILVKLGYLVRNVVAPWRMADHSDSEFHFPAYPREVTCIHEKAIEVAIEEIEHGNNVLIFGINRDALELIAEELGKKEISVALLHGGITGEARERVISRAQRKEIQALVGSYGVLAEGLNLGAFNRAIITESDWTPSTTKQAVGRITRGIQETIPKAIYISARGTIQEYMIQLCKLKGSSIAAALDRTAQKEDSEIPDIQQYAQSLVGVGDDDEVQGRLFEIDMDPVLT